MELNFFHLPNKTFHMSGVLGQDIGVVKLDVVTQVYAVLSHG
jgi:hypothetical protein